MIPATPAETPTIPAAAEASVTIPEATRDPVVVAATLAVEIPGVEATLAAGATLVEAVIPAVAAEISDRSESDQRATVLATAS